MERRFTSILPAVGLAFSMTAAHAAAPADLFDFWLGDWNVSWKNADGTPGRGRNRVAKILDDRVIEENFEQDAAQAPPLLRGRSLSVLHVEAGVGRQPGWLLCIHRQRRGREANFRH